MLGAHEDQHLGGGTLAHDVRKQRALLVLRHLVDRVRHEIGRRIAARDLDQLGLVEQLVGELLDFIGERRREQQVLPLRAAAP